MNNLVPVQLYVQAICATRLLVDDLPMSVYRMISNSIMGYSQKNA